MRSTAVLDLQVAETMYSCVMLALKLLKAFCPEAGPHQFSQIVLGWPSPAVLKALQVSSISCTQNLRFLCRPTGSASRASLHTAVTDSMASLCNLDC